MKKLIFILAFMPLFASAQYISATDSLMRLRTINAVNEVPTLCEHKTGDVTVHEETQILRGYISFKCTKCQIAWLKTIDGKDYITNIFTQLIKK